MQRRSNGKNAVVTLKVFFVTFYKLYMYMQMLWIYLCCGLFYKFSILRSPAEVDPEGASSIVNLYRQWIVPSISFLFFVVLVSADFLSFIRFFFFTKLGEGGCAP